MFSNPPGTLIVRMLFVLNLCALVLSMPTSVSYGARVSHLSNQDLWHSTGRITSTFSPESFHSLTVHRRTLLRSLADLITPSPLKKMDKAIEKHQETIVSAIQETDAELSSHRDTRYRRLPMDKVVGESEASLARELVESGLLTGKELYARLVAHREAVFKAVPDWYKLHNVMAAIDKTYKEEDLIRKPLTDIEVDIGQDLEKYIEFVKEQAVTDVKKMVDKRDPQSAPEDDERDGWTKEYGNVVDRAMSKIINAILDDKYLSTEMKGRRIAKEVKAGIKLPEELDYKPYVLKVW